MNEKLINKVSCLLGKMKNIYAKNEKVNIVKYRAGILKLLLSFFNGVLVINNSYKAEGSF